MKTISLCMIMFQEQQMIYIIHKKKTYRIKTPFENNSPFTLYKRLLIYMSTSLRIITVS